MTTRFSGDEGSAAAEFVLVGALLTVLTLSILQLGLVLHIRNTVTDAAAEGARIAALADNGIPDGIARTSDLISVAIGVEYAGDVTGTYEDHLGHPSATVIVRAPLPVFGLLGFDGGLEVEGHAAVENLE